MVAYFIFLLIVLIIAYLTFRTNRQRPIMLILLYLVMTCFAGFRSSYVGTDSASYAHEYEELSFNNVQLKQGLAALIDEPGFYFLQKLLGSISNEYIVLFLGVAGIFCFFVLRSVKTSSVAPVLSLFVFITLGYYTFVFNAARQGLAMAIYMISIPYLMQRKFWRYMLVVLIAASFHKTIIIAIPLYFIFTMRYSYRTLALVTGGGLLVGYFLPDILSFGATIEERYTLYIEGHATGGYLLTFFYVILAIFFIAQRKQVKLEVLHRYDVFLLMLITGSAMYLVVTLTQAYVELTRFAAYFQTSCIFLWAMLAKERKRPLHPLVYILAIIGHLGYFAIYLTQMASLVPYAVNPNIFIY